MVCAGPARNILGGVGLDGADRAVRVGSSAVPSRRFFPLPRVQAPAPSACALWLQARAVQTGIGFPLPA